MSRHSGFFCGDAFPDLTSFVQIMSRRMATVVRVVAGQLLSGSHVKAHSRHPSEAGHHPPSRQARSPRCEHPFRFVQGGWVGGAGSSARVRNGPPYASRRVWGAHIRGRGAILALAICPHACLVQGTTPTQSKASVKLAMCGFLIIPRPKAEVRIEYICELHALPNSM